MNIKFIQFLYLHAVNKSSVVSLLVTAQKQCLGKCHFNTQKCLFIFGDAQKCVFDNQSSVEIFSKQKKNKNDT
jgi:hypothetical protein